MKSIHTKRPSRPKPSQITKQRGNERERRMPRNFRSIEIAGFSHSQNAFHHAPRPCPIGRIVLAKSDNAGSNRGDAALDRMWPDIGALIKQVVTIVLLGVADSVCQRPSLGYPDHRGHVRK